MSVLRLSAVRERLRSSLWLWPALAVGLAVLVGTFLPMIEDGTPGGAFGFAGTPDGARAVLATVAGSTITVTGLTFSMTVVALQVASSQFTPRLLDSFLADRGNQAVLSVFLGTFAYTLAVLRSVRNAAPGADASVPDLSVAIGLDLTLLSVAMLVYFFHHLTQQLRVESVLNEVREETVALIRRHGAARDADEEPDLDLPEVSDGAVALRALRTGYLQAIDIELLAGAAACHGAVVCLRPVVGTHVTVGTTLAWAWAGPADGHGGAADLDAATLTRHVHEGIHLGAERTLQQDIAFGVRQLVDIAARALSPGVNDPATAVAALGTLAAVLVELAGWRLDPIVQRDDAGDVRAMAPQSSFAEILSLACDQPRRYGRTEPAVLIELVRMLTDLAEVCRDPDARDAVRAEIDATVEAAAEAGLTTAELARVETSVHDAGAALERGARVATLPAGARRPAP
jgi:uncharacterized membrane protein